MAGIGEFAYTLDGRTDHAKDAARWVGRVGEDALLDVAQGLGRGGVAGEDDEGTTHVEKLIDGLLGEGKDLVEGAVAVRGALVVTQENIVVLWQELMDLTEDRKASEAAVKDADWCHDKMIFSAAKIRNFAAISKRMRRKLYYIYLKR